MADTSFKITLYRLGIVGSSTANTNQDLNLTYVLDYDFRQELDSRSDFFWRNLIDKNDGEYIKFYETKLDSILKNINDTAFELLTFDLSDYYTNYTLKLQLNNITDVASLEIKQGEFEIQENDLIEIMEENQVIFLGFVSNIEDGIKYNEFSVQKITLVNVGKIYALAKISSDRSLADYGIKGKDLIFKDATPFQDIFNNQNTFEIIETIMSGLYKCKIDNDQSKTIEYILDPAQYETFESFNIMFPMMYLLYLYNENVYKPFYNEDLRLCRITNGKHKTYNEKVKASMPVILPTLKTTREVFENIIQNAMYDMFVDYNGTLVVRPPLYNYFPLEDFNPDPDVSQFKQESEYVISRDKIQDYSYVADNTSIETRSDAFFTWPYVGVIESIPPQFYEDIPALVKFGFRYEGARNNPNAIAPKTARILAMLYNHKINNGSRVLRISIKSDLPIEKLKFELGRLYYIDLPDLKSLGTMGDEIEDLISGKRIVSNKGIMGYLTTISKAYSYGTYIIYDLDFAFIRDIKLLNLSELGDSDTLNRVLDDLYNIYHPYGYIEDFQDKSLRNVSPTEYENKKAERRNAFKQILIDGGWFKNVPIFKTMPSVIDLIELTYSDPETKAQINKLKNQVRDETKSKDLVFFDDKYLWYKSYKLKMERFFRSSADQTGITLVGQGLSVGNFLGDYPYILATEQYYDKIEYVEFNSQDKSGANDGGKSANDKIYNTFIKVLDKNVVLKNKVERTQTIDNYQKLTYTNPYAEFVNFKVAYNNSSKNKEPIAKDNTLVYQFPSRLPLVTKTSDGLTKISQKLANRIIELDMEMFEVFKTPYAPNMFFKTKGFNGEIGPDWDSTSVGDKADVYKFTDSNNWTHKSPYIDDIFEFPAGKEIRYMPKGVEIEMNVADDKVKIEKVYYGNHFWNNIFTQEIPSNNSLKYFSPGFFFNMHTILEYNTLMAVPTQDDLKKLKKLGINENAEKQEVHKQGRAIDFILPAQTGSNKLPWVYYGLLGYYNLKSSALAKFNTLLLKYFDKVVITQATLNFDLNQLKGLNTKEQDMRQYTVDVYHVEVNDKDFLNPEKEVFRQGL